MVVLVVVLVMVLVVVLVVVVLIPALSPPQDLEFYRIRAFRLGKSGRMAAHALDYVPSPRSVVYSKGYGRQPLWYCSHGCCHGPHSYEVRTAPRCVQTLRTLSCC